MKFFFIVIRSCFFYLFSNLIASCFNIGFLTRTSYNCTIIFINFQFFATSPAEFWRRWHISLSSWVKDYVFFPLAVRNKSSKLRIASSIFVTMFLIGIWHGAGLNFIIYGIIHGAYVGIETLIRSKFPSIRENSFLKSKFGKIITILSTQYLIFLSFLAFRVHDLEMLSYSIQKFIFFDFMLTDFYSFILEHKLPLFFVVLFVVIHCISYKNQNFIDKISNLKLTYWTIFLILLMSCIIFFYDTNPKDFIYFRF